MHGGRWDTLVYQPHPSHFVTVYEASGELVSLFLNLSVYINPETDVAACS